MATPNDIFGNGAFKRSPRLRTVRLGDLRVSPAAQREHKDYKVAKLVNHFDPEKMDTITVSHRDGMYWIIDGHHRVLAFREWLGEGHEDVKIEAWCWEGLTEQQEAVKFLELNDVLAVSAFDKFQVGVTGGMPVPTDIDRVVRSLGLKVARAKRPGAIHAVSALEAVYGSLGPGGLAYTLAAIRDGFGDQGYEVPIIRGVGTFYGRYGSRIDNERLAKKLNAVQAGFKGLMNRAYVERERLGQPLNECVAAVVTTIYNQGLRGPQSLGSWWKPGVDA